MSARVSQGADWNSEKPLSTSVSVLGRMGGYVPVGSATSKYGRGVYGAFLQVGIYVP